MARASRSKRSPKRSAEILIATSRPSRVSRARYTVPIPPAPMGATISYGPSLVPGLRSEPVECGGGIAKTIDRQVHLPQDRQIEAAQLAVVVPGVEVLDRAAGGDRAAEAPGGD